MMDNKQISHGKLENHTKAIKDDLKSLFLRLLHKGAVNKNIFKSQYNTLLSLGLIHHSNYIFFIYRIHLKILKN